MSTCVREQLGQQTVQLGVLAVQRVDVEVARSSWSALAVQRLGVDALTCSNRPGLRGHWASGRFYGVGGDDVRESVLRCGALGAPLGRWRRSVRCSS
jgi:hypothetical protein